MLPICSSIAPSSVETSRGKPLHFVRHRQTCPSCGCGLQRNQRRVTCCVLTLLDPNPNAIPCNSGQCREQKTSYLRGIRKPVQLPATSDRTLVMSRKAVRVRSSALSNKLPRYMWHIFSQLSHGGGVGDHRVCYLVVKRKDWHRFLLLASQFFRFR
jgi:hypothetical protein